MLEALTFADSGLPLALVPNNVMVAYAWLSDFCCALHG
jgi:hypothetical protein